MFESVFLSDRIVVMAARPGRVIRELQVDEPYPRGEAFRTSASLPPPDAVGMELFGKVQNGCAGVVWDCATLDLADALCWPSGVSAKTEFNLTDDGNLLRGRSELLVDLEALREANSGVSLAEPPGESG